MQKPEWIDEFMRLLRFPDTAAFALKDKHIPESLYKYISLGELAPEKLSCLASNQIWIANPETMNDPYDSGLYFLKNILANKMVKDDFYGFAMEAKLGDKFDPKEIEEIRQSEDVLSAIFEMVKRKFPDRAEDIDKFIPAMDQLQTQWHEQLLDGFNRKLRSSLKISCFTEVNDSMLMWSHYGNSHKGICVEYDFSKLTLNDPRKRSLYPVNYSEQFLDATSLLMDMKNAPLLALQASLYKSPEWSYEKEWRLIIPGGIIPDDSPYEVPQPVRIYLGSKIAEIDKSKIIELARPKGIQVFQMRIKHSAFGLFSEPVE